VTSGHRRSLDCGPDLIVVNSATVMCFQARLSRPEKQLSLGQRRPAGMARADTQTQGILR
jgi:hypothetical protein